ncbi:UNVERIFIED_ORG: hypothetical protein ABIB19_002602 [Arthrobacter sp. UYEF10]
MQDTARFLLGLSVLRAGLADADPATAFEALLAEEDIPVGELAHRLGISPLLALAGYYDQPHLIRTFRRFSGFTPSGYLRLIRQHGPEYATFVPLETPTAVR